MSAELFSAVASGNTERVRELLASDPGSARGKDDEGATALHYAALNGHRKIALALVEQGADINARDERFGATPAGGRLNTCVRRAGC
jgi:ankyrin repeat protein